MGGKTGPLGKSLESGTRGWQPEREQRVGAPNPCPVCSGPFPNHDRGWEGLGTGRVQEERVGMGISRHSGFDPWIPGCGGVPTMDVDF
jgi:hypothetical protein